MLPAVDRTTLGPSASSAITETAALSKIPCLSFINSTSLPNRPAISARSSSLRSSTHAPAGVRTCVGTGSPPLSSSPTGWQSRSSGKRLAVSHGKPLSTPTRRKAIGRSPSCPCHPRNADSVAIPAMDLTG